MWDAPILTPSYDLEGRSLKKETCVVPFIRRALFCRRPLYPVIAISMQRKVAFCSLWLRLIILLLEHILSAEGMELQALRGDDMRCLFKDRDSCKKAQDNQCEWCELPQECYHLELVSKLGANCNGSQRRQLKVVEDCADIASKEKCVSLDHCRWCRSEALDDGCFRAWEARRLPIQVFDCSKVS